MKRFALMILGVSTIFICLGGAAKQLRALFGFNNFSSESRHRGEEGVRFSATRPRVFIKQPDELLILQPSKERIPEGELKIHLPPPPAGVAPAEFSFERLELPRRPGDEPLDSGVELPRVDSAENVIIVKRPAKEKASE